VISGIYNITIEQGATFSRTILISNPDDTPYDLTGFTARMHIRRDVSSSSTMMQLTTENGRITLGGDDGEVVLSLTAVETATIDRNGVYDLELVSGGEVHRLIRGAVHLIPEVTR